MAKHNFALDVTANTYAGEHADQILAPAIKAATTMTNGSVTVMEGIQNSAKISGITEGSIVQAGACDTGTPAGATLNEATLALTDLMVNEPFCRKTLMPTFFSAAADVERNGGVAPSFEEFIVNRVAGVVAKDIENGIWLGGLDSSVGFLSNDGAFDASGFAASSLASANDLEYTGSATGSGKTIEMLEQVMAEVTGNESRLLNAAGAGFYLGTQAYWNLKMYLGDVQNVDRKGVNQGFENLVYLGLPVYHCAGMPADVVMFTYPENLIVGTNLSTDMTEVQVIPEYQFTGSDNVRFVARFGFGVTPVYTDDVVLAYDLA